MIRDDSSLVSMHGGQGRDEFPDAIMNGAEHTVVSLGEPRPGESSGGRRKAHDSTVVLVVDATPANRYAVAHTLRLAGIRVVEAASGNDALRLSSDQPDLIVLDVNLPDMSGSEVLRTLKRNAQTGHIPVLHVSETYVRNSDRGAGNDASADAHLTHPIDPVVLLTTIRSLLRAVRAEMQLRESVHEWALVFDSIVDAIFLLDEDGAVLRSNRAAAALVSLLPQGLTGRLLPDVIERAFDLPSREAIERTVAELPVRGREVQLGERWFRATADDVNLGTYKRRIIVALADARDMNAADVERRP